MKSTLYDELEPYDMDLSVVSTTEALSKLGLARPILRVHATKVPFAMQLNRESFGCLFNIEVDERITDTDEWYVEYDGKRFGSQGA